MYRIGQGIDAHKFDENSKLILGGIEIPYELGLKGHSDADVLLHAICDALLGAIGEKDIGSQFPDTDKRYKGISSIKLLETVLKLLESNHFGIVNLDTVVICEKPRLAPYIDSMKEIISKTLKLDIREVSIKATTTECMGFTGRGEGIAATAIVLVKKI
ncbi:MAG: 2-C-methyl-D-erythritol 2,4-cyclodiphosphate synthase [Thermodesulfobacteriota bacterium]